MRSNDLSVPDDDDDDDVIPNIYHMSMEVEKFV